MGDGGGGDVGEGDSVGGGDGGGDNGDGTGGGCGLAKMVSVPNMLVGCKVHQKYTVAGEEFPTVKAMPLGCSETYGSCCPAWYDDVLVIPKSWYGCTAKSLNT